MIIANKISLILNEKKQNSVYICATSNSITSSYLLSCLASQKKLYTANTLDLEQMSDNSRFYTDNIDLPKSTVKCGSLLKNWNDIAGRESTPTRELLQPEEVAENEEEMIETSITVEALKTQASTDKISDSQSRNCVENTSVNCSAVSSPKITPEYFSNIEDKAERRMSISPDLFGSDDEGHFQSHNLMNLEHKGTEGLKNERGICYYESYCKDAVHLAEDCVDLTQSSDDENEPKYREPKQVQLSVENENDEMHNESKEINFDGGQDMNVTDYVYQILNKEQDSLMNKEVAIDVSLIDKNISERNNSAFDLTQGTEDSNNCSITDVACDTKSLQRENVQGSVFDGNNSINETKGLNAEQNDLDEDNNSVCDLTQSSDDSCHSSRETDVDKSMFIQKHLEKLSDSETDLTNNVSSKGLGSNCSKNSIIQKYSSFSSISSENAQLSDEELNYSCVYSTPKRKGKCRQSGDYSYFNGKSFIRF